MTEEERTSSPGPPQQNENIELSRSAENPQQLAPVSSGSRNGVAGITPTASFNDPENTGLPPQQPQQQQGMTLGAILKGVLMRALIIYLVTSFFKRGSQPVTDHTSADGKSAFVSMQPSSNLWSNGTFFDLYVFISGDENRDSCFQNLNYSFLFWRQNDIVYGDWTSGPSSDGSLHFNGSIKPTTAMLNNGSIFTHVFAVLSGKSPDPSHPNYAREHVIYRKKQLNRYRKKMFRKTQYLLTGETDQSLEDQEKAQLISYEVLSMWHPRLTINMLDDHTAWVPGRVPKPLDEHVEFEPVTGKYYPVLYLNDYWNLNKEYYPINDTLVELPLMLTYQPITLFRWQLYLVQSTRNPMMSMLTGSAVATEDEEPAEDMDALKEALLDTNPYLLALTGIVSLAHMVFELLAFKNDIQFWKERETLEGLSVRSVFFNVFQSLVVLLYIMDNDANMVVKMSVFMGMCIELWKVKKVITISIDRNTHSLFGALPFRINIEDKGTYVESSTREYDELAFRYLGIALFPLVISYFSYSLMYHEHKGWYSFIVSMVYSFLLTFGFIMMTPQLFINYKLKSVAHLPWRMLTYKFLNTFIDDIFAFVIKMPTMYRLSCFRDDIIFIIYLYQRWIYQVDPVRVNEFGTSAEVERRHTEYRELQNSPLENDRYEEATCDATRVNGRVKKD